MRFQKAVLFLFFLNIPLFADSGFITGTVVNVRASPSLSSNSLTTLSFADQIEIVEASHNFDYVQGAGRNHWYHITRGSVDGWVFGAYIAPRFCISREQFMVWVQVPDLSNPPAKTRITVVDRGLRQTISSFDLSSSRISFSPDCRFLAAVNENQNSGELVMYRLPFASPELRLTIFPSETRWDGDLLKFNISTYGANPHCYYFQEASFRNGVLTQDFHHTLIRSFPRPGYENESCPLH